MKQQAVTLQPHQMLRLPGQNLTKYGMIDHSMTHPHLKTSFTMRGATRVTFQPHQILRLPRQNEKWLSWLIPVTDMELIYNVRSNIQHMSKRRQIVQSLPRKMDTPVQNLQREIGRERLKCSFQCARCEHDPNPCSSSAPPVRRGYFFCAWSAVYWKQLTLTTCRAPAIYPNFTKCTAPATKSERSNITKCCACRFEEVTLQHHLQCWALPRKVALQRRQMTAPATAKWHSMIRSYSHMNISRCRTNKSHLQLHQILRLPRKMPAENWHCNITKYWIALLSCYFTITLLNCYLTQLTLLNCYFTACYLTDCCYYYLSCYFTGYYCYFTDWAVTSLNCYFTDCYLLHWTVSSLVFWLSCYWLNCVYFTELFLYWTVTLLSCYFTELLLYRTVTLLSCWAVTLLTCYFTELLLYWAVTLLSCYFTELVTLLSCYFTELLLYWAVTSLTCYLIELLLYFTELLLNCYFTELLIYWIFYAFWIFRYSEVSHLNFLWWGF